MYVIAAPGHRVPMQGSAHEHIEPAPAEPVEVPDTSYYRRRIAAGELLRVRAKRTGAKQTAQESSK